MRKDWAAPGIWWSKEDRLAKPDPGGALGKRKKPEEIRRLLAEETAPNGRVKLHRDQLSRLVRGGHIDHCRGAHVEFVVVPGQSDAILIWTRKGWLSWAGALNPEKLWGNQIEP